MIAWLRRFVTDRAVSRILQYADKFIFVSLFFTLGWLGQQMALSDSLRVYIAVFIPFGIMGGLSGLLGRKRGEARLLALLRGSRNWMLRAFLFSVGLSSVALLFFWNTHKQPPSTVWTFPVLSLAAVSLLHTGMRLAEDTGSGSVISQDKMNDTRSSNQGVSSSA